MSALTMTVPAVYKYCTIKQQGVTTSATVLTALAATDEVKNPNAILVQAAVGNSGTITLGRSSGVTSLGAGIHLAAGANIVLPTKKSTDWYAIGSTGTQNLNIIYMELPE